MCRNTFEPHRGIGKIGHRKPPLRLLLMLSKNSEIDSIDIKTYYGQLEFHLFAYFSLLKNF